MGDTYNVCTSESKTVILSGVTKIVKKPNFIYFFDKDSELVGGFKESEVMYFVRVEKPELRISSEHGLTINGLCPTDTIGKSMLKGYNVDVHG